jgi:uncharacterized protein YbaP (TraB family)
MKRIDSTAGARQGRWVGALAVALLAISCTWLPAAAQEPAVEDQPALWRVSNAGASTHLFGSVHMAGADLFPLPAPVEAAFDAAAVLAVEIDVERLDPAEQTTVMRATGFNPPGVQLSERIGPKLWSELGEVCVTIKINCEGLQHLRPWLAALSIAVRTLELAGFSATEGVDRYFLGRARADKTVVSLETLREQLQYFGELDDAKELDYLQETLAELDVATPLIAQIVDAWRAGDVAAIDELVNDELRKSDVAGIFEALMVKRNVTMAERIHKLLKGRQSLFVVVGAGHLAGQHSLLDQLKQRGWAIERVQYP